MMATIELIAEISGCHGGSLDNAIELIEAAKAAGATGVKFQAFDPERLAIRRAGHPRLRDTYKPSEDGGPTSQLRALYQQTHTPQHWFPEMIAKAGELGLTWHASVFDPEDVTFLETLDCPRYKVASFEATDRDLVMAVELTRKPIIISANQNEDVRPPGGALVLHATNYAVSAKDAKLARIRRWAFDKTKWPHHWPWGLSDHTTDCRASQVAVTLGARMIEWHIRLPDVSTPDDAFAWTPAEFTERVARVREIEEAMNG